MQVATVVTQKGQVTIPVDIRKFLKVRSGDKITFIKTSDKVLIKPAGDFLSLKGSVKTKRKYSDEEADKTVLQYVKHKYDSKASAR